MQARSIFNAILVSVFFHASLAVADTDATPSTAQPVQALLDELRVFLREQVAQQRVPGGAVLIVHQGKPIFREGFGWANPVEKEPFLVDAPVRIASITKPIVATGIVALAADNRISLDEPISTWLPEFKSVKLVSGETAKRAPNLRELLSHTGGVQADESKGGRPWMTSWARETTTTLTDVVAKMSQAGLVAEPGAEFAYSGNGYDLAVHAVEVACKTRFEDELRNRIFKPLKMIHSTFRPNAEMQSLIPPGYNLTKNGFVPISREPRQFNASNYVTYGGNLISTIDDLGNFLQFHLDHGKANGQQIIPEKAIREMHRKPSWSKTGYGLGWSLGVIAKDGSRVTIGHTGSSGTACSMNFQQEGYWIMFTQMPQPKNSDLAPHFHLLMRERAQKILAEASLGDRAR